MGIVDHAKREFEALGWPGDCEMQKVICDNVIEILEVFANQGHSGSSAPYVMGLVNDLGMYKTITPLTGEDDEWTHHEDGDTYQNKRCSAVFKHGKKGTAYWIYGRVFREPNGSKWTNSDSRVNIEFPWKEPSEPEYVDVEKSDG